MNILEKPILLFEGSNTIEDLKRLKREKTIWKIRDIYKDQLRELFEINYPHLKSSSDYQSRLTEFIKSRFKKKETLRGSWIYFPWNGCLIHIVTEKEYNELRSNRNKNLITRKEQEKLLNFTVGIAGLSIGNSIALGLVHSGIGNSLKLADIDSLETTNLNRVRATLSDIGVSKVTICSRQIYEVNPYAKLKTYEGGLTKENIERFLVEEPRPNLIFEEIDDFQIKVLLRLAARCRGIPVIMLTNLGDNVLVDIERYDRDKNLPLFNGFVDRAVIEFCKSGSVTKNDVSHFALQLVGRKNVPSRVKQSLQMIGKKLVGRPQLMSTVTVSSGIAALLTCKIALGKQLESGRSLINLDCCLI